MTLTNRIHEIDADQWENLVNDAATASFFSTRGCYDFYASLSFLEEFIFAVSEEGVLKGIIVGYIQSEGKLLSRYFTRRAIIPGGALLDETIRDEALIALLEYTKEQLKGKAIYVEFRNYNDYGCYKKIFVHKRFKYIPHLNFHVDCSSEEIMINHIGKHRRKYIRMSLKSEAEVIVCPSEPEVAEFYHLLEELYATRVKTPLFPIEFFMKLKEQENSLFLLLRLDNVIIGGIVCVYLKNRTVYEWFICGLDQKYRTIYPSTLIRWSAMDFACKHSMARFDMMGAGKPGKVYGVRDFKAEFGGQLVEHGRFLCVLNPVLYQLGKLGIRLLKQFK